MRGVLVGVLLAWVVPGQAAELPQLWGYGVKGCRDYLDAWEVRGEEPAEYRRFEDWLTGLISGLSLATAEDVLRGVDIPTAMERIRQRCEADTGEDFFNASMDLVRRLSVVR